MDAGLKSWSINFSTYLGVSIVLTFIMSGVGEFSCEGGPVTRSGVVSPSGLTGTVRGDGMSPTVTSSLSRNEEGTDSSFLNTFRFSLRTLGYFLGLRKSSELSSLGSSNPLNSQWRLFLKKM